MSLESWHTYVCRLRAMTWISSCKTLELGPSTWRSCFNLEARLNLTLTCTHSLHRRCRILVHCITTLEPTKPVMLTRRALSRLQQSLKSYPPSTHTQRNAYSTVELANGVKIAYDLHEPPSKPGSGLRGLRENAPPIIVLHGLFGSKKNNRSMSKYARVIQHSR